MVFEQIAIAAGLLDVSRFEYEFLYIAILALAGTLLIWTAKRSIERDS